jgi:putative nucleotidyltransferase with HDIG domain
VQKGAQDFLIKGQVDGNVLSRAIHYAIERKQVEEALKESERLLHEAQRLGRIGNWSYDLATHQITWSDEVFELYERKKNLGPPTEEEEAMYYPPEQAKNLREYARFSIETGREFKYDIDVILPSGKTGFFTASMRPIKDKDGHVTKLFGTVQDITERKLYEEQLKCSYEKLQNTLFGTISALSVALEKRDPYTANHQRRVTKLACAIAEEMGISEKQIEGLRVAGMLHDIGKIYVPAEILSKPSSLTKAEFDIVKTHVTGGYEILASVEFPWPVARIIIQHHERVDGSGYPDGLKTDNILVEAKILAVADVVEAMASHRPYRPAKGINQALDEITNNKGVLYDSRPVDACLKIFRKGDFQFDQ